MKAISTESKIADLILNNHFLLLILERFEIDLGLQDKTIKDICFENNISTNVFQTIYTLHKDISIELDLDLQIDDIKTIVGYLKKTHEYYKNEVLPKISEQIKSIYTSNNDLTFVLIERFFEDYKQEVLKHLDYEETKVFPYTLSLISKENKYSGYDIDDYKNHHEDIESKLTELKNLLIKHLPEKYDRRFRRKLLFELFRLERDISIHTIIEENILIPAIEKIESNS